MFAKQKGCLRKTLSMNRWKARPEFLRPKGILIYSNRPNGVIMAVFGISSGSQGSGGKL